MKTLMYLIKQIANQWKYFLNSMIWSAWKLLSEYPNISYNYISIFAIICNSVICNCCFYWIKIQRFTFAVFILPCLLELNEYFIRPKIDSFLKSVILEPISLSIIHGFQVKNCLVFFSGFFALVWLLRAFQAAYNCFPNSISTSVNRIRFIRKSVILEPICLSIIHPFHVKILYFIRACFCCSLPTNSLLNYIELFSELFKH